jgi:hypothetical protein
LEDKLTEFETVFCSACGNKLISTAVICPSCGSPTSRYKDNTNGGKRKSTAVILAVFFGYWSFLYTYSVDRFKFWCCLASLAILGGFWGFLYSQYQQNYAVYEGCGEDGGGGNICANANLPGQVLLLVWIVQFIIWLISLLVVSTRDPDEYRNYKPQN